VLFVGESLPASGRFFYQGDSGLYRAMRDAFLTAVPGMSNEEFLEAFRAKGCYLIDLCGRPVDRMEAKERKLARGKGERRLGETIKELRPDAMVILLRAIAPHVRRAQQRAGWHGLSIEVPYPGRWKRNREEFMRELTPMLRGIVHSR
jgi:hypothetical protein